MLFGSNTQQMITNLKNLDFFQGDTPADKVSIQLGINLYYTYKDKIEELNYQTVLDELEKLPSVGKSRLLHYCFDMSEKRITYL